MINKKFMILAIFLVGLLAVSAVSAADNATGDIVGVEETTDEVVSVNENQTISEDDVLRDSPGTFTDLANEIAKANGNLDLNRDYAYSSSDSNYKDGIDISKKITINGNGHTINGNNQARAFNIKSTVTLNNIAFTKCSSTDGGAIYISSNYATIKGCSFDKCHADGYGGAIMVYAWDTVIRDCSFDSCSANLGGAVFQRGCSGCVVRDSIFTNCRSNRDGSAVYWSSSDDGTLSGCSFKYCNSDTQAAVYWSSSNYGTLSDCSFTYCSSYFEGGAIYLKSNNCIIKGCTFFSPKKGQDDYKVIGVNNTIINGKASAIVVNKNNYYKYGSGELTATLTTDSGKPISGANVVININKASHHLKTNTNGQVKLSVASLKPATYVSTINFEGDNNYAPSSATVNVIISKMDTTLSAKYDSTSKNIIATVKDTNGNAVRGIKVGFAIDGVKYVTTDANGQAKYSTSGLANKKYSVNVMAYGDEIYDDSNKVTVTFDLSKIKTTLTAQDVVTTYKSGKNLVATLKDASGKVISGAKVTIKLGTTTKTQTTNSNGQVSLTTDGLIPDTYVATISFEGNDVYDKSSTTAEVTINKLDTKLTARYDANSKNIVATVKDSNGNPIKGLRVGFALNGVKYVTTDANGQAKYSTAGLADGTYKITVQASGNEIYKDSNKETVTFTIGSKEMSKIFLRNALYFVTQTKLVQVTLWDGNNQPLANKTVYIRAYDSVWHGVTDENGDAFVRVGIGFGTHDATVSFDGDDQYFGSEKAGYIRVIKQTPSVMVRGADTMFKATNPVKIVKVHLRDRYDQPLPEGSKIVLKLNGKTYIGFTDAEGVARIAISINTVGTFTAQAMYGGNTAYNAVTRDVKIRIV